MSSPRVRRTVVSTLASSRIFWKARMSFSGERSNCVPVKGVERDQVDLGRQAAHQLDELARVLGAVVHALHHGVLERDGFALLALGIARAGRHQFGDRIFLVERHELRAQFVVGRMQRHRERYVGGFGQLVDHRHQARGRERDALVGEAQAEIVAHDAHRGDDVIEVEQRLAHAHHHHVGELALMVRHVAQVLRRHPHLADDLGGGKIAIETLRRGAAELAVQTAADLARHAQRAAALVGDEHGFDGVAAVHAEQPLVRAVGRRLLEQDLRRHHDGGGFELAAQALAEVRHFGKFGDVAVVDPLHHLVRAVALFVELRLEEIFQTRAVEFEQVGCAHPPAPASARRRWPVRPARA